MLEIEILNYVKAEIFLYPNLFNLSLLTNHFISFYINE